MRNKVSGGVLGNVIQGRDVTVSLPAATPVAVMGLPAQSMLVGRDAELAQLAKLFDPAASDAEARPMVVSAVAGLAGVGKTALVVRAAHDAMAAGWFPGGVLMVDLRGYDTPERRVPPLAALASLLGALGIRSEHIPSDQADRERLWRSVLAHDDVGKRMLIVLDNTSSAEQVRPLLPGAGGHQVVITSRHSLADLDGVRLVEVDVLSPDLAVEVLEQALTIARPDDGRVSAEPHAAVQLGQLCGGLPLALRIAAALLTADPDQAITELTAALTFEQVRLERLDYDGSLTVRAAFDLSYQHLTRAQARLFRLLALNPGPEISIAAAAALANHGTFQTRQLVSQLRRAHLLHPGTVRGRWRMHDLVRLYAQEQDSATGEREAALDRLIRHYVTTSQAANQHLDLRVAAPGSENRFATRQDALKWLDSEHPNLVGAVTLAYDSRRDTATIDLANALYEFFWLRLHIDDWIITHQMAVVAARKLKDRSAEGRLLHRLGFAYWRNRQYAEAATRHLESLAISRELGDRSGEADALRGIGATERGLNHPKLAEQSYQEALVLYRDLGDLLGEAKVMTGIGLRYADPDGAQPDRAADHYRQALWIYRAAGDRDGEAGALGNLGNLYFNLGQCDVALECHHQALEIWQALDDRHGQAGQMNNLGVTYQKMNRWKEATDHLQHAAELYRGCRDHHAQAAVLHRLGTIYRQLGFRDAARTSFEHAMQVHDKLGDTDGKARVESELDRIFNERGQTEYHRLEIATSPACLEDLSRMSALLASSAVELDAETEAAVAKLLSTDLSTFGTPRRRIQDLKAIREALLEDHPPSQPSTGKAGVNPARRTGHEEPEQPRESTGDH